MRPKIYVAGPYTAATPEKRDQNIATARAAGIKLAQMGFAPLIPHCNTALWDELNTGLSHDQYLEIDLSWLAHADAIYFLCKWVTSAGCRTEHDYAMAHGIKIIYACAAGAQQELNEILKSKS